MHEVLTSLKQHQTQKFLQNLINFEKHPKILQKPKLFGHCEKYIEISFYLLEVLFYFIFVEKELEVVE